MGFKLAPLLAAAADRRARISLLTVPELRFGRIAPQWKTYRCQPDANGKEVCGYNQEVGRGYKTNARLLSAQDREYCRTVSVKPGGLGLMDEDFGLKDGPHLDHKDFMIARFRTNRTFGNQFYSSQYETGKTVSLVAWNDRQLVPGCRWTYKQCKPDEELWVWNPNSLSWITKKCVQRLDGDGNEVCWHDNKGGPQVCGYIMEHCHPIWRSRVGRSYLPDELRAGDFIKLRSLNAGGYGDRPVIFPWWSGVIPFDTIQYRAHYQFTFSSSSGVGLDPDWSFDELFPPPKPGAPSPPPPPPDAPPRFFACESCAIPKPLATPNAGLASSGLPLLFAKYFTPVGLCTPPPQASNSLKQLRDLCSLSYSADLPLTHPCTDSRHLHSWSQGRSRLPMRGMPLRLPNVQPAALSSTLHRSDADDALHRC